MTMLPLEVFYKTNPLGKILSFAAVTRKFRITIDTDLSLDTNVYLNDGTGIVFKQCSGGLYYYEMTNMEHNIINSQVTDYTFLNTV